MINWTWWIGRTRGVSIKAAQLLLAPFRENTLVRSVWGFSPQRFNYSRISNYSRRRKVGRKAKSPGIPRKMSFGGWKADVAPESGFARPFGRFWSNIYFWNFILEKSVRSCNFAMWWQFSAVIISWWIFIGLIFWCFQFFIKNAINEKITELMKKWIELNKNEWNNFLVLILFNVLWIIG